MEAVVVREMGEKGRKITQTKEPKRRKLSLFCVINHVLFGHMKITRFQLKMLAVSFVSRSLVVCCSTYDLNLSSYLYLHVEYDKCKLDFLEHGIENLMKNQTLSRNPCLGANFKLNSSFWVQISQNYVVEIEKLCMHLWDRRTVQEARGKTCYDIKKI